MWNRKGGLSRTLVGGSATLADALAAGLRAPARCNAVVTAVRDTGRDVEVEVEYTLGDVPHRLTTPAAIVATPAHRTAAIVDGLDADTRDALGKLVYGPYVVGAFLTTERRSMPWEGIYALATRSGASACSSTRRTPCAASAGRALPAGA